MIEREGGPLVDRHDGLEGLVGETRTTVRDLRVEAGKVAEFAHAIGDDDPVYRDADAAIARGFDDVPAPLTFTRVGRFPRYQTDESIDLGFRHEDVLHGGHAYEYERPVVVGDVLRGETTLTEATEREGTRGGPMTFAELETVYYDAGDERVLTERATVIETDSTVTNDTGKPSESARVHEDSSTWPGRDYRDRKLDDGVSPDGPDALEATAPEPVSKSDLAIGESAPSVTVGPLYRQDFVRYAGASGDFNPIHYDEPYAHAAGNQSVFGQGMFTAGVAAHTIADWVGLERIKTFAVRFQSRVWPGDEITASATVTGIDAVTGERTGIDERGERGKRIEADLQVTRGDEEVVLTGHAAAVLGE